MPNRPKTVLYDHFNKLTATERNSPVEWMEGYSNNREPNSHFLAKIFAFRKRGGSGMAVSLIGAKNQNARILSAVFPLPSERQERLSERPPEFSHAKEGILAAFSESREMQVWLRFPAGQENILFSRKITAR